jgi:isoquinoline 1-oxidoreductase alpha subunit
MGRKEFRPMHVTINGKTRQVEAEAGTPILWVIRDKLGMTGTKTSFEA